MRQSERDEEIDRERERGRREKAIIGSSHKNFVSFVFLFSSLSLSPFFCTLAKTNLRQKA